MEYVEPRQPKWLRSTKGAPFTGIGSLEADILAIVWEKEKTTVRDVYETLRERRQIAYTTVMTVMNNLVKKHLLTQDKTNIAYVYTPAIPGREVARSSSTASSTGSCSDRATSPSLTCWGSSPSSHRSSATRCATGRRSASSPERSPEQTR